MSLNRIEEQLFNYLQRHPEERQFIRYKVRESIEESEGDEDAAARFLNDILWSYHRERSRQVDEFFLQAPLGNTAKLSFRNLAEYLLRIWGTTVRKKARSVGNDSE